MDDIEGKTFKRVREPAKPMPRARLIPITTVLQAFSEMPNGRASIHEIADALIECYDIANMMMYATCDYGLADAIDGDSFNEFSGIEERRDIISEFFNSRYWVNENAGITVRGMKLRPDEIQMSRDDIYKLGYALWEFFEPDDSFDVDEFNEIKSRLVNASPKAETSGALRGDPVGQASEALPRSPMPEPEALKSEEKPLGTRERNTLLIIIAALCKATGHDYTRAAKTAGIIHGAAMSMGVSVGETTIEHHLKSIPGALEARTK